jgi:hypothetical protein
MQNAKFLIFNFNLFKRGQALLFVFFLLLITGILSGALADMWQAEVRARGRERNGLIAFYLAQAGIERGKIEILYDVDLSDIGGWNPGPSSTDFYFDLDIDPTDKYTFCYNFHVEVGASADSRIINATGEVQDANGNSLAHREISVTFNGVEEGPIIDDTVDDPDNVTQAAWSWKEL